MNTQNVIIVLAIIATVMMIAYQLKNSSESKKVESELESERSEVEGSTSLIEEPKPASKNKKSKKQTKIVLFYAPWCGYCTQFMPVWKRLKGRYPHLEEVDCDANKEIATQEEIKSFPTVRAYITDSDGKNMMVAYPGDRSEADLEQFINSF